MYKPEIDDVLTRHLGRVAAPEELWERIERPQARLPLPRGMPVPQKARVRTLVAVAVMMLIVGIVVHKNNMSRPVSKSAVSAACRLCHTGV